MARDAIAYHDDGLCGYLEHAVQVQKYREALDILEPRPVLTSAIPAPNPG
jgi:hypothetical protein